MLKIKETVTDVEVRQVKRILKKVYNCPLCVFVNEEHIETERHLRGHFCTKETTDLINILPTAYIDRILDRMFYIETEENAKNLASLRNSALNWVKPGWYFEIYNDLDMEGTSLFHISILLNKISPVVEELTKLSKE